MESGVKTPFCAICGRNHDPKFACAPVTGFEALEGMGDKFSKEKDTKSFEKLSKKSDKLMIMFLIVILLVLFFIIVKHI